MLRLQNSIFHSPTPNNILQISGIEAAKDIVNSTGNNNLIVRKLDLASIEDVRKFAQQINDAEQK